MDKKTHRPGRPLISRNFWSFKLWIACGAAVVAAALFVLIRDLEIDGFLLAVREMGPVPFFIALALLPAVGFPTTPFFLLAGAAFGMGISIVASLISLAFHLAFCYWLATRYFRGFVERMIARTRYRIPQVRKENFLKVTLLIKMTPGPPTFLKTYILGLTGIPFGIFFTVSLLFSGSYAIGLIVLGDSLLDGDLRQALIGVSILVFLMVGIKMLRDYLLRLKDRREAVFPEAEEHDSASGGKSG